MSLMMQEISEQPTALERTLRAERNHAREFERFAKRQKFRMIVLVARGTSDNAALFGRYLLERFRGWPRRHPRIGDVRGLGLMIGLEVVKDQTSRTPDPAARDRIVDAAFARGLLVLGCGASTLI